MSLSKPRDNESKQQQTEDVRREIIRKKEEKSWLKSSLIVIFQIELEDWVETPDQNVAEYVKVFEEASKVYYVEKAG